MYIPSLIETKVQLPPQRSRLVPRPRLTHQLDAVWEHRLTLVCAPGGFGKTSLATEWISTLDTAAPPIGWFAIDAGDNTLARFSAYLLAAVGVAEPGLSTYIEALLPTLATAPTDDAFHAILINLLALIPGRMGLILEDYHLIEDDTIHTALANLLDHAPPHLHLMILTRTMPPLALSRLRARGQLLELGTDDLRFNHDEVEHFLDLALPTALPDATVTALETRTEGWAAGLQLAALSWRARPADVPALASISGGGRLIADFFNDEVLTLQPPTVQRFLIQTSIVDRLCGPLADALLEASETQPGDGQTMLDALERDNVFTFALDAQRRWYRYHALFVDMLRRKLDGLGTDAVQVLHRRAAIWFARNNMFSEALHHARAAVAFDLMADLLETHGSTLLMRGEMMALLEWIEVLPEALIQARPRLGLLKAWPLIVIDEFDAAIGYLALAEQDEADFNGEVDAIRASIATLQGDSAATIQYAERALGQVAPDNRFVRNVLSLALGNAQAAALRFETARRALQQISTLAQTGGDRYTAVSALCLLAQMKYIEGRLTEATRLYEQALDAATPSDGGLLPMASLPMIGLGMVAYQRGTLAEAEKFAAEGLALASQWWVLDVLIDGHVLNDQLLQAKQPGRAPVRARDYPQQPSPTDGLVTAALLAEGARSSYQLARVQQAQMRAALRAGDLRGALRLPGVADLRALEVRPLEPHLYKSALLAARLALAQGRHTIAARISAAVIDWADEAGLGLIAVEARVIDALRLAAEGSTIPARLQLIEALKMAATEGLIRVFCDEGLPLWTLIGEVGNTTLPPAYLKSVRDGFGVANGATEMVVPADKLSDRELQVLRLIAAGLAPDEIAGQLVLSVGTVRNHLKNIYSKLDVHNRVQAVQRAQTLGLL